MQVATELSNMFSYSFLLIIIVILALICCVFVKLKDKSVAPQINEPDISKKDIKEIINAYLIKIDNLVKYIQKEEISNRDAYQKLSLLVRHFVFEVTNIKVQNYSLREIEKLNMPSLYELIKEFYHPEFAVLSQGEILKSIAKTKGVIASWK